MLRCQAGDQEAFAQLVARYQPRLRVFLSRMLDDDPHSAADDDALQDIWLDVFRGVGKLHDCGAFPAWLYRIARDRAYRVLRRRRRVLVTGSIDHDQVLDPRDEVELEPDERRLVHESLQRLPHEQREVLLLRFVEDLSYDQIADAVGCAVGTVRSRLHYGKLALRRQIDERNNAHDR